jgi:hypothetical protein
MRTLIQWTISLVARAGQWPARVAQSPFPRRIRRVNRGPSERRISLYNVASPIRPLKPREMFRTIALTGFAALVAAMTISLAPPARAQIGNIFSDPAPRPPGSIPRGNQQQQQMPDEEEEVPELPQGRLLPTPNRLPPGQGVPAPGSVQTQPLPPPPGTTIIPQNTPPGVAVAPPQPAPGVAMAPPPGANPLPGLPPGQRQPKGGPQPPAALQPGDEVVTEPPAQKIVNKKASFSGLDKITGRIINFDEDIGETVQFGALRVKTDACYTRPATEAANTDAFVEVDEITLQGEVKRIFSGWMFAASPGLHGVEHPIYDIWLTDCKVPDTTIVSAQPDPPKAATPTPPPAQKRAPPKQAATTRPLPPQQQQPQVQPPPPPPPQQQQPGGLFSIFR